MKVEYRVWSLEFSDFFFTKLHTLYSKLYYMEELHAA